MFYFDVRDREVFFPLRKAGVKNFRVNSDRSEPEVMMGIKHIPLFLEDAVDNDQRRSLILPLYL